MSSHGTMNTVGRRCKKEVFSLESHPLLYETELKVLQKSTKMATTIPFLRLLMDSTSLMMTYTCFEVDLIGRLYYHKHQAGCELGTRYLNLSFSSTLMLCLLKVQLNSDIPIPTLKYLLMDVPDYLRG